MTWELTEEEKNALPAWARRGVMPHRAVQGPGGVTICEGCEGHWSSDGCDVVVLTRHLAQALADLTAERKGRGAAEQRIEGLALQAASLVEQRDALMALWSGDGSAFENFMPTTPKQRADAAEADAAALTAPPAGPSPSPEALTLTPAEVATLRDVLRYAQRVVAGTLTAPARFSDLELSDLALRTAVLVRAMERAG